MIIAPSGDKCTDCRTPLYTNLWRLSAKKTFKTIEPDHTFYISDQFYLILFMLHQMNARETKQDYILMCLL